ncbi:MAG: hypothetical protein ACT6QU_10070 [Aliihoeflea sp.]|uniref:hypothetical protein n=1 Tax=Aliihoeflea sp. TaxID=2608088 RepID=UPI00403459D6
MQIMPVPIGTESGENGSPPPSDTIVRFDVGPAMTRKLMPLCGCRLDVGADIL